MHAFHLLKLCDSLLFELINNGVIIMMLLLLLLLWIYYFWGFCIDFGVLVAVCEVNHFLVF